MNPTLAAFDAASARIREALDAALKRRDYATVAHVLEAMAGVERTTARQTVKKVDR